MKRFISLMLIVLMSQLLTAQFDPQFGSGNLLKLNDDGSHYLKFTLTNQVWLRWNESNPGTLVDGTPKAETVDLGIRRSRIQMFGALNNRSFVYVQLGMNNFNALSDRKSGLFFHDIIAEYTVVKNRLNIGGGLTNWVGISRLSNASIATFLPMDSPIFPFATIDATDQFNRKLSLYAKGKLGRLDYRLEITDPMEFSKSPLYSASRPIGSHANFATGAPKKQTQAYIMWQFAEQESNLTPYLNGSYLGTKRVINLGAGFAYQPKAMWYRNTMGDTLRNNLGIAAIDFFFDSPLNKSRGNALTAYLGLFTTQYGKGYLRNLGIMNPANGVDSLQASFNGPGNAYPLFGTGKLAYTQIGYLIGHRPGKTTKLRWQPYICGTLADYDRLNSPMVVSHAGLNLLLNAHNAKVSFDWENRPVYRTSGGDPLLLLTRKNTFSIQLQVAI